MRNRRNYYRILHVQPDAPFEIIRTSYRTLMKELKLHPDLGGQQSSAALLNEAYETLRDSRLRSEYDKKLRLSSLKSPDPQASCTRNADGGRSGGRRINRVTRAFPLCYSLSGLDTKRTARLIDISPRGAAFECPEPLGREQTVHLNSPVFHAAARVRQCSKLLTPGRISYRVSTEFTSVEFSRSRGSFISTAV